MTRDPDFFLQFASMFQLAEESYCPTDGPQGMGWCMALGRFLIHDQLKVSHVYKRFWPMDTAVSVSPCL